jgi:hypothetical protein
VSSGEVVNVACVDFVFTVNTAAMFRGAPYSVVGQGARSRTVRVALGVRPKTSGAYMASAREGGKL